MLRALCRPLVQCTKERLVPAVVRQFCNHCTLVFSPTPLIQDYLQDIGVERPIAILPTGLDAR